MIGLCAQICNNRDIMGKNKGLPRGNLDSRSNKNLGKTLKRGFGIVRMLTAESEQRVFNQLTHGGIGHSELVRRPPLHATVIGFMGMSKREQAAFNAGFNVSRLEQRLEKGVEDDAPRTALTVVLGGLVLAGNMVYSELDDDYLKNEQTHLAGQVAMHGIHIDRIDKKIITPHVMLGFVQSGPAEEVRERMQDALIDTVVGLQRWNVYPGKYS